MTETAEKEINEQHISELLNQVNSLLEIKRNIPRVPGIDFNIFSVLNMESDEENTHNRLIYEFLNKDGSHGMGDVFLREFFKMVLEKDYPKDKVNVYREYVFDDGRIDILIHGDDFCYPIEMKIYAGDQHEQIKRYYEHAEKECPDGDKKVYYLTLDGHEPSEDSLGDELYKELEASKEENINEVKESRVKCISFDFHIRNWLERCSEIAWKVPSITGIIQQYIKLLDKLTGHIEEDIIMGGIKNIVGSSKKNYESALAIEQSLPKIRAKKMIEFFGKIKKHMDSKCKELCSDYIERAEEYYDKSKNRVYPHLSYCIRECNGIKIVLRFEVNHYFFFGINFYDKNDNQLQCCAVDSSKVKDAFGWEKWKETVLTNCKPKEKKGKNSPWLWWMYLPSEIKKESEASDKKDVNFMTGDGLYKKLFDPEDCKALMGEILEKIDKQIDSICGTGLPIDWK